MNHSTGHAYAARIKNGYRGTFCDRDGHTGDWCHMNPDKPDNHLPEAILDQLRLNAIEKPKRSGKSSQKVSKVEIAGVTNENSSMVPPTTSCVETYADCSSTAQFFLCVSAFVPDTLMDITHKTIELAYITNVNAMQQEDVKIPFQDVNIRLSEVMRVPNLGYKLVSVGRFADKGIQSQLYDREFSLQYEDGFEIGRGSRRYRSGLYTLSHHEYHTDTHKMLTANSNHKSLFWLFQLAHMNEHDLRKVNQRVEELATMQRLEEVHLPF